MVVYIVSTGLSLYGLMFPLSTYTNLASVPPENFVVPLWAKGESMHLRVYLSTREVFNGSFLQSEFAGYQVDEETGESVASDTADVALLWDEALDSPAFSKSFLLTSLDCKNESCENDKSYQAATEWLDQADRAALLEIEEGAVLSNLKAGQGIESTSILLTLYQSASKQIRSLFTNDDAVEKKEPAPLSERTAVNLPPRLASALSSNSTLFVHVLVVRGDTLVDQEWPPTTADSAAQALQTARRQHGLLLDNVELVKFDAPHHIIKPGRILAYDLLYIWNKLIMGRVEERPPWDMEYTKPKEYGDYKEIMSMKERGEGYPYWKPEVAIKYVNDEEEYPIDLVERSGLPLVQMRKSTKHPTGVTYTPAIHVDEIGLTSEKYIPVNGTTTSLPLRISFDRSDMEHHTRATTATAGGISPARWRLLSHLSQAIESQQQLGFDKSDIDDVRRLIADTNVMLLSITMLASALHLLFEYVLRIQSFIHCILI
jgi:hypothetical protein